MQKTRENLREVIVEVAWIELDMATACWNLEAQELSKRLTRVAEHIEKTRVRYLEIMDKDMQDLFIK